jgi:hypothetical protein
MLLRRPRPYESGIKPPPIETVALKLAPLALDAGPSVAYEPTCNRLFREEQKPCLSPDVSLFRRL